MAVVMYAICILSIISTQLDDTERISLLLLYIHCVRMYDISHNIFDIMLIISIIVYLLGSVFILLIIICFLISLFIYL
jgi:hypothetical protein